MAILSVTGPLGPSMTINDSLSDGATGTVVFRVISDNVNESPAAVMNALGVPVLGTPYPDAPDVLLHNKSPNRQDADASNTVWLVTCEYKSILSQEERDRKEHRNPLDRKATIEIETRKYMKAYRRVMKSHYYQNYDEGLVADTFLMRAAANSATDPYEPVYEAMANERIILVKKNLPFFPLWFLEYEDAVNEDEFVITAYGQPITIKKGCGKVGEIKIPKAKQENGFEYVQFSYQIVCREFREMADGETDAPEPWDDEILDAGMRTYDAQDSEGDEWAWTNVKDSNENGVTLPVPFNGFGRPIKKGADDKIEEEELYWSLVRPFKRKTFTGVLPIE